MKVPLKSSAFIVDGNQFVEIWSNGVSSKFKSPVTPYVYSKHPIHGAMNEQIFGYSLLYDKNYNEELYKCTFRNTKDKYNADLEGAFETRVKLLDRLYIDYPDFCLKYANTAPLKILSLDIETDSFMSFPNADENAIIAIGMQFNDNPIEIYMSETHNNDNAILRKMLQRIKEEDPDIIVTYNGNNFDMPYIVDRLKANIISSHWLSRDGTDIEFKYDDKNKVSEVIIGGRIHYDIMKRSVKDGQKIIDQNLFKRAPKHYDMKTIAKIYKCPDVIKEPKEIMSNMRSIVNTERLAEYLTSDIRCTTFLRKIYLPAIIGLAEYLQVPLYTVITMTPSYTGSIIFARKFGALKIIGDMTVGDANPYLAANKEGALVKTFRWGLFKRKTRDVDFTSFYPNLIVQLNLCPTTTRIVETRETLEPFNSWLTSENFLMLSIPDNKAQLQVIIEIDMNKKGIAAQFVQDLMADRKAMKIKMNSLESGSPEWTDLDINQLNLKVIINALTGMFGLQSALFGSLASYIAITGTGRHILQTVKDYIGDEVISINTDGLYMTDFRPLREINDWLESYVKQISFSDKSYIWLEESEFEASYFQPNAEKHYLLLSKSDSGALELIIHGGGLKGSARIQLFSSALADLGMKLLTCGVTKADVDFWFNRESWTLDDITFSRTCKSKKDYKNKGDLGMKLITQYENRFNTKLEGATSLSYIKIIPKRGESEYKLITVLDNISDIQNIDYKSYEDEVIKVLERLSLEHLNPKTRKQRSLFDFG